MVLFFFHHPNDIIMRFFIVSKTACDVISCSNDSLDQEIERKSPFNVSAFSNVICVFIPPSSKCENDEIFFFEEFTLSEVSISRCVCHEIN